MSIKKELDALKADVARRDTVESSARALIEGLRDQLASALAKVADAEDSSEFENEIQEIHDSLAADPSGLAAAVSTQPAAQQPVSPSGLTTQAAIDQQAAIAPTPGASPSQPQPTPVSTQTNPSSVADQGAGAADPVQPGSGSAGDTTTGSVASAGASPNEDNVTEDPAKPGDPSVMGA